MFEALASFSVIEWGLKYALNKSADAVFFTKSAFATKLDEAANGWAKALPPEARVYGTALFRESDGPARRRLAEVLSTSEVPDTDTWFAALEETRANATPKRDLTALFHL